MPELIVFPNDREINYYKECEYSVDVENKKFEAFADDLEIDVTQINQKFCRRDNIFIAFSSENVTKGFALIFPNDQGSKEINESFKKMRETNGMVINYFRPTFSKFLNLIFNGIQKNIPEAADLRRIVKALKFSDVEKIKFNDIILTLDNAQEVKPNLDVNVSDQQPPVMKQEPEDVVFIEERAAVSVIKQKPVAAAIPSPPSAKPAPVYVELWDSDKDDTENQNHSIPLNNSKAESSMIATSLEANNVPFEIDGQRRQNLRKRLIKEKPHSSLYLDGSEFDSDKEENVFNIPLKKKRGSGISNLTGEIIKPPGFKFIPTQHHGRSIEKLVVVNHENPNFCYQYAPQDISKGYYYCYPCKLLNLTLMIKLFKNTVVDGTGDYVQLSSISHVCNSQKPIEYMNNKPIDNAQNIMDQNNSLNANLTFANQSSNNNDNNENNHEQKSFSGQQQQPITIRLSTITPSKRGCRKSKNSLTTKIPLKQNDYKLEYFVKTDGTKTYQLSIYHVENKELCYTYYFDKTSKCFICSNCKLQGKQGVRIKLHKNETNNNEKMLIAEYGKASHICEPQSEGPIIPAPNFEIQKNDEGIIKNLIIFSSENKKLCYSFFNMNGNRFFCHNCSRKVCAKIFENDNGEFYVKMGSNPHHCLPILYTPSNV